MSRARHAVPLLAGDRARAEELFGRSLQQDPSNLDPTLPKAGVYLGVEPG
jgi:Tfp pilus assembly protein PilF